METSMWLTGLKFELESWCFFWRKRCDFTTQKGVWLDISYMIYPSQAMAMSTEPLFWDLWDDPTGCSSSGLEASLAMWFPMPCQVWCRCAPQRPYPTAQKQPNPWHGFKISQLRQFLRMWEKNMPENHWWLGIWKNEYTYYLWWWLGDGLWHGFTHMSNMIDDIPGLGVFGEHLVDEILAKRCLGEIIAKSIENRETSGNNGEAIKGNHRQKLTRDIQ